MLGLVQLRSENLDANVYERTLNAVVVLEDDKNVRTIQIDHIIAVLDGSVLKFALSVVDADVRLVSGVVVVLGSVEDLDGVSVVCLR